jgi:deoxyhypusine synthase
MLGPKIRPGAISSRTTVKELVDEVFCSFNSARLRESCRLLTRKMLEPDVTVGLSISGALTPAGLGMSAIIPLIEHGFVDWIVSTGANLDYEVLLSTDDFIYQVIQAKEFNTAMSTAEFHFRLGKYVREREKLLGLSRVSLVSAAYEAGVPIYTSAPGDSSIGMNIARAAQAGCGPRLDISRDVNETAAIVFNAKGKGKSAAWILGGGSPKNFLLQTEPYLQEMLGKEEAGHDYFLQITDARPDSGGLSGATPSEAVSWGKIDPERLPDAVVCYADVTIALPIITTYALASHPPREQRRLYERREELVGQLGN